jgi:hypothetical protein
VRAPLKRAITGVNVFYPKIKECKSKHNYPNILKVRSSQNNLEKFYTKLFQFKMLPVNKGPDHVSGLCLY